MSRLVLTVAVALLSLAPHAHAGDAAAMKLLPPGVTGLLQIDLAGMRGTLLYKELFKLVASDPKYLKGKADVQEKMGFDLEKDLSSITLVVDGKGDGFIVLQGKFDQKKITGLAQKEGKAKPKKYQGVEYWVGGEMTVLFLSGRVIVGKEGNIKQVIGAHKGKRLKKSAAVLKIAKGVDQKKHIWGAIWVPAKMRDSKMKALATIHGYVDLSKGLSFLAVAGFDNEKSAAKLVTDAHKALKEAQSNPGLAMFGLGPLLTKVKATAKGKSVSFAADWNEQDVQRIKALAGMAAGMMGGGQKAPAPPVKKPKGKNVPAKK